MVWRNTIIALALTANIIAPSWAGQETHGGDVIDCGPSTNNSPISEGLYALDYIQTFRTGANPELEIAEVHSWEESRARLRRIYEAAGPYFLDTFDEFLEGMENESDYSQPQIWENAAFGLVDISDEDILRMVPENCTETDQNGQKVLRVRQAILRTQNESGLVIFQYDKEALTRLRNSAPLQYSFIMHHEFLRAFVQDADVIRRVNRFVHSNQAAQMENNTWTAKMDSREFANLFYRMGLIRSRGGRVCEMRGPNNASNYNFNVPDEVVGLLIQR